MYASIVLAAALLTGGTGPGLRSPNFVLANSSFDVGGQPVASPSFRVTLTSAGQGAPSGGVSSPTYAVNGGIVAILRPAAEVKSLRFTNRVTLAWAPEGSGGTYQMYRGALTRPFDGGFGSCAASALPSETASDATTPALGHAFFYLATARNRLGEEGSKGHTSAGTERANPAPCP